MEKKTVVIERILNAPVSKVWEALINNQELKQWYFQLEEFRAEKGFQFTFKGDTEDCIEYTHLCEVTEVIAEKKLAYTWKYEGHPGDSLVCFELRADGKKTHLTLTHTGLESFAGNGKNFTADSFNGGWTHFGDALKAHVEKA